MGDQKGAGILWTDFTFNGWHGCTKMLSEANWRKPLLWNADAEAAGVRARVFCASMADVFEKLPADHPSAGGVEDARERLWELIDATPSLDWLLLTKRPENIHLMSPPSWWGQGFPENVWVGTSVEDQAAAGTRIPHLLKVPARVRFLSCEPLLGLVNLTAYLTAGPGCDFASARTPYHNLHWVIVGGESGPHARPMHPDWARSLRDQCQAAGVPFFFKQYGNWQPMLMSDEGFLAAKGDEGFLAAKGDEGFLAAKGDEGFLAAKGDEGFLAAKGQVWDWRDGWMSANVGKHAAGRLLDGQAWNEFPAKDGFRG